MGTKTSKDMGLRLDNLAGTLNDIGAQVNQQTLRRAVTILDDTGMGESQHGVIRGLLAADRIPLNGRVNSTTEDVLGTMVSSDTARTVEFKSYTGRYYNGEVHIESYELSGNVDTIQTWSCELVAVDGLTRTSVALA